MIRDSINVWDLLETLEPTSHGLRVREEADIEGLSGRVLFGIDIHRHRHLLIPVASVAKITEDRRSRGVQIIAHLLDDNGVKKHFVDLVCLKPHLNELFSVITDEVLDHLRQGTSRPDQICHLVLERWRELLERDINGLPGIEKLVGLYGELWFLRELVKRDPTAVQYWRGSEGHRHDFSVRTFAVEVKTTQSRHGCFIEIHGHEQLEAPENGQLYMIVVKVEQVSGSGESLPELVDSILSLGGDRHKLFSLLAKIDLSLLAFDSYNDTRFQVRENHFYKVDDGFPRIIAKNFVGNTLPDGIIKLNYQIDLSTEPPYSLDNSDIEKFYAELFSEQDQV